MFFKKFNYSLKRSIVNANWVDRYYHPISKKIADYIKKINFITPNLLTFISFLLVIIGSLLIFFLPRHIYFISSFFLIASYLFDHLDGEIARQKRLISDLGDYLDKTLDVLKIFIIFLTIAIYLYIKTKKIIFIFLSFISCFFFNYRYYIKLETVIKMTQKDSLFLKKFKQREREFVELFFKNYNKLKKGNYIKKIYAFFYFNKSIFFIDEGEIISFTALGILFDKLDIVLIIFSIIQVVIAFLRLIQRGHQIITNSENLYNFIKK